MVSASTLFPGRDPDARVKEIRSWLNAQGVRDFEPVSLYCDQLKTVMSRLKISLTFLIRPPCLGNGG
jgi:Exoribonuclease Xrn1 D2/D3 domain